MSKGLKPAEEFAESVRRFVQLRQDLYLDKVAAEDEREHARATYRAMADICAAYCKQPPLGRGSNASFPGEVASMLGNLLQTQLAGHKTQSFEELSQPKKGEKTLRPGERRDIAAACLYVRAAKAGVIGDRSYVKTLASWFGVDRRTVMGWTQHDSEYLAPQDTMEGRSPQAIINGAQLAGRRYGRFGRGFKAMAVRDAKR